MAKLDFEKLNSTQQYSQHAVFRVIPGALGTERADIIDNAQQFFASLPEQLTVRGIYDLSGMRAVNRYNTPPHTIASQGSKANVYSRNFLPHSRR